MARKKLTVPFLDSVKNPPKGKRLEFSDMGATGLTLRVTDKGAKLWSLLYRVTGAGGTGEDGRQLQGRTRRLNIGRYPDMGLAAARTEADRLWTMASEGKDPALAQRQKIKERIKDEALTFGVVAAEYIEEAKDGRKVGSGAITKATAETRDADLRLMLLPHLADTPLVDIDTALIFDTLREIEKEPRTKKAPSRRDAALGTIRAVFHFAILRGFGDIKANPAVGIPNRETYVSRERVLGGGELSAVWTMAGIDGYPFGTSARLLILTGQRKNEVGKMRWRDIDLDKRVWTLSAKSNKSRRANEIPLSDAALDVLAGIKKRGDYVFSTTGGEKPINGWSKYKTRLAKAAAEHLGVDEMEPWVLHDFRRTAATGLAELGVIPTVISLILNHSVGSTLGIGEVYNKHHYMDEKRSALDMWAEVVVPPPPDDGKVVKLNSKRKTA